MAGLGWPEGTCACALRQLNVLIVAAIQNKKLVRFIDAARVVDSRRIGQLEKPV
jgi:hypothetical protein